MSVETSSGAESAPRGRHSGKGGNVWGFVLSSMKLMVLEITVVKWQQWELSSRPATPPGRNHGTLQASEFPFSKVIKHL